nr:basic proline-rich protein-like [Vulpes vulpes]
MPATPSCFPRQAFQRPRATQASPTGVRRLRPSRSTEPPPAPPPPEAGEGPRRAAAEPAGAPPSPPSRLSPRPPGSHTQTPPGGTISGEGPTAPHGPSTTPHPIKAPRASSRQHFRFRQHQISRERTLKGCRLRLGPLSRRAGRGRAWRRLPRPPGGKGRAPRSGAGGGPGVFPASPGRWSRRAWLRQRPPTSTDEPLEVPGKGAADPAAGRLRKVDRRPRPARRQPHPPPPSSA